jgi:hypothetical protein
VSPLVVVPLLFRRKLSTDEIGAVVDLVLRGSVP